jgi:hypothetical protein
MAQRLRRLHAHARIPSVRWGRFILNVLWLLAIFAFLLIGVLRHSDTPLTVNQAFSLGIQRATFHHLTPGPVVEWVILALALASIRWIVLELRAVLGASIEVRPVDNASGREVDTHPLDVAFREYMTLPKLYQLTTIPGDLEPEHLVEVLKVPSAAGWRGLMAAAFSYAFPRRAFIVSASLRRQAHEPLYGVAVQVRRLPGLAAELETQWSTSFERALQRGAYAAVAYILPQTRACNNVPWSAWRRRAIPVSLLRDYQRAKKMVAERRYDEALNLYHQALLKDANNIDMRYDVGQLYERLGLYPDALYNYLNLVDQLFPARSHTRWNHIVRWSGKGKRDSFVIWYRYVITLALGAPLARELLHPDWEELREWLTKARQEDLELQGEDRPLRTIELLDIRRRLADRLHEIYPSQTSTPELDTPLRQLLNDPCTDEMLEQRSRTLERCLLKCAELEAKALAHSIRWSIRRYISLRGATSLTLTAVRQVDVAIQYRLTLLDRRPGESEPSDWTYTCDGIEAALRDVGYKHERSTNWLEHYNAACTYALIMRTDTDEDKRHLPFAYAAVSALELALRYGEDIDFVRTKKYWLQAGDPDFAGLRRYTCFRAFEARIYGRPLPATANIAKYELYLYLRAVLEDGAENLEREWRRRAVYDVGRLTHAVFEEWWRQEQHAWELAIRLGRFYRQWQTRREAVESRRNWIESFGQEARPVGYPNLDQPIYMPDIGDFESTRRVLEETDAIFHYLGKSCGRLVPQGKKADTSSIMAKTRDWFDYAARCAQLVPEKDLLRSEVIEACEMRAAMWSTLRHWARNPTSTQRDRFVEAVKQLKRPPRLVTRGVVKKC